MVDIEAYKDLKNFKKKYLVNRVKLICFIFLLLIHILDVLSTLIGLQLGAVESNPTIAYFFTFGFFGWVLSSIYIIFIFILVFIFVELLDWLYEKMTYRETSLSFSTIFYMLFSLVLFIGIAKAVINNISVIIYLIS